MCFLATLIKFLESKFRKKINLNKFVLNILFLSVLTFLFCFFYPNCMYFKIN